MQVSEIDEDFVDIISILNEAGLRPFSSCDGVESHHTEDDKPLCAYIGLLESKKGIDLLAACLRDKSNFDVLIENSTHKEAYMLYGNRIEGNVYLIFFDNSEGERTNYFERIVRGITDESIKITDDEKRKIEKLNKLLKEVDDSDLTYRIKLNNMHSKDNDINSLSISTKVDLGFDRDMHKLGEMISSKYGMVLKSKDDDIVGEIGNFITVSYDQTELIYYFHEGDLPRVIQMIRFARAHTNELLTFELKEINDDFELD